jgi:hypothetical protein
MMKMVRGVHSGSNRRKCAFEFFLCFGALSRIYTDIPVPYVIFSSIVVAMQILFCSMYDEDYFSNSLLFMFWLRFLYYYLLPENML